MSEALLKLATWLSPSYPISAYAYSHGLEAAVSEGHVRDAVSAEDWISGCLIHGAGRTDMIVLARAWRGDDPDMLMELIEALVPAKGRLTETSAIGQAFAETTATVWGGPELPHPYPIVVGLAAQEHEAALDMTLMLFAQAYVSMLVSAVIRLVPLGQTDGQRIIAALAPTCLLVAKEASIAELGDIGGCAVLSDIAAMRQETLTTRIFRT